jgi:hypothetical protein
MPDDLKLAIRQAGLALVPDLGLSVSPLTCTSCDPGCQPQCKSCATSCTTLAKGCIILTEL